MQFWSMVQNMSVWCKRSMLLGRMPFNTFCGFEQHLQTQRAGFILQRDKNEKGTVDRCKNMVQKSSRYTPKQSNATGDGGWLRHSVRASGNETSLAARKDKNLEHTSKEKCARNQE